MTNDEKIRAQILNVMAKQGLRQAPLARRLGITPQSLNQVIKGERAVLPTSLTAVLDELGLELAVKAKDDKDVRVPVVGAAPEKPEGGPTLDDREWLEAFLTAAKAQSPSAAPYGQGSIVLVRFDTQQLRPCVTITGADTARKSQVCGVVPLAAPSAHPIGGLTPTFQKGDLPASSTAMCTQVQTVELAQVVSFVGRLNSRQLKNVKDALGQMFSLDRASNGRYVRR